MKDVKNLMYAARPNNYTNYQQEATSNQIEEINANVAFEEDFADTQAVSGIKPLTWLLVIMVSLGMWAGFFYLVSMVISLF